MRATSSYSLRRIHGPRMTGERDVPMTCSRPEQAQRYDARGRRACCILLLCARRSMSIIRRAMLEAGCEDGSRHVLMVEECVWQARCRTRAAPASAEAEVWRWMDGGFLINARLSTMDYPTIDEGAPMRSLTGTHRQHGADGLVSVCFQAVLSGLRAAYCPSTQPPNLVQRPSCASAACYITHTDTDRLAPRVRCCAPICSHNMLLLSRLLVNR